MNDASGQIGTMGNVIDQSTQRPHRLESACFAGAREALFAGFGRQTHRMCIHGTSAGRSCCWCCKRVSQHDVTFIISAIHELAATAQDVGFIEELTLDANQPGQPDALRVAWVEGKDGSRRNRRALFTSFPTPVVAVRTIVPQWRRGTLLCGTSVADLPVLYCHGSGQAHTFEMADVAQLAMPQCTSSSAVCLVSDASGLSAALHLGEETTCEHKC